jgi:bifunctional non-homologous end joining protein LigD
MGSRSRKTSISKRNRAPRFVIQEHHARALHWDFRLEHEGVLVSWALPKGLPETPATNHLAVHTEDHPIEYLDFEGDIPKGEYGGGTIRIWDRGTYDLEKWKPREVMVVLHGNRASGRYVLFPTRGDDWMIHRMDPAPADYEPMPGQMPPMLAVAGALPATDEGWSYEFKWDGVRAIVFVDGGRVRALTRNGKDLVASFPELRAIGEFLGSRSAIIDGEIVAFDADGRSDFGRLQQRLHIETKSLVEKRAREVPASYLAFDLLYLEGHLLISQPYDERRRELESLKLEGSSFATPPAFHDTSGTDVLRVARERGLEGVVIKRRQSRYSPNKRSGDWIKVKNIRSQEVVIGGWTDGKGARAGGFGALLLGVQGDRGLTYVGKVGTGFTEATQKEILRRLRPLAKDRSPFATRLAPSAESAAHFVRPKLVGEVRFNEWTRDGLLRQPSWRGLREDKTADEVVRES